MGTMLETRYRGVRRHLDKLGYQDEAFPVEALSLVQRILIDFGKTTDTLRTVAKRADHFAQLAQEFEGGVEPFKEESVRLTKENSELRLGILRANEKIDKDILANRSRLRDLESENTDLKLLVKQFVKRLKGLELETFHKTKRIADLQERNLEAVVISSDGERRPVASRKQRMEINCPAPPCCQHCIRIRNYVEYGGAKWKEPCALDYIKIADSRIECLQLQARCLKSETKDLTETVGAMEIKVEERDKEIDRLKHGLHTQPGGKMLLSSVYGKSTNKDNNEHALRMSLKATQLQLNILHKRNFDLEAKLQESVLDGHHKFMSGRASAAETQIIDCLVQSIDGGFPTYLAMSMEEKNKLLEAQLSHCCKEKAKLKFLLEQCEGRNVRRHRSSPTAGRSGLTSDELKTRQSSRSPNRTKTQHVGFQSNPETAVIFRSRSQNNGLKSRVATSKVSKMSRATYSDPSAHQRLGKKTTRFPSRGAGTGTGSAAVRQEATGQGTRSEQPEPLKDSTAVSFQLPGDAPETDQEHRLSRTTSENLAGGLRRNLHDEYEQYDDAVSAGSADSGDDDLSAGQDQQVIRVSKAGPSFVQRIGQRATHFPSRGPSSVGSRKRFQSESSPSGTRKRGGVKKSTMDHVSDEESSADSLLDQLEADVLSKQGSRKPQSSTKSDLRSIKKSGIKSKPVPQTRVQSQSSFHGRNVDNPAKSIMSKAAIHSRTSTRDVRSRSPGRPLAEPGQFTGTNGRGAVDTSMDISRGRSRNRKAAEVSQDGRTRTFPVASNIGPDSGLAVAAGHPGKSRHQLDPRSEPSTTGKSKPVPIEPLASDEEQAQVITDPDRADEYSDELDFLTSGTDLRTVKVADQGRGGRVGTVIPHGDHVTRGIQTSTSKNLVAGNDQRHDPVRSSQPGRSEPVADHLPGRRGYEEERHKEGNRGQNDEFQRDNVTVLPADNRSFPNTRRKSNLKQATGTSKVAVTGDSDHLKPTSSMAHNRGPSSSQVQSNYGQAHPSTGSNRVTSAIDKLQSLADPTATGLAGEKQHQYDDRVDKRDQFQDRGGRQVQSENRFGGRSGNSVDRQDKFEAALRQGDTGQGTRVEQPEPPKGHTAVSFQLPESDDAPETSLDHELSRRTSEDLAGGLHRNLHDENQPEPPKGHTAVSFHPPVPDDVPETSKDHKLSRRTSENLAGGLRRNLQDEYQQYNVGVSQPDNPSLPISRQKDKDKISAFSTQELIRGAYRNAPGPARSEIASAASVDYLASDADSAQDIRAFVGEDVSQRSLPHRSETRTTLQGESVSSVGRGPTLAEWLTLNSDVETYRREIERLRNVLFSKEDSIDKLTKDHELFQRKMKNAQAEYQEQRKELPPATQSMIRRLEDERDKLQDGLRTSQTQLRDMERQVSSLKGMSKEGQNLQLSRVRDSERILEVAKRDLKQADMHRASLENEIRQLRRDLDETQGHAQKWRREAESVRDTLEETEQLLLDTQKRLSQPVPSAQTDARLGHELTQQFQKFSTKEQSFEREIISLKTALKVLDRDKDEMRVELDRKDCRLAKVQSEIGQYMEELARLNLRLQNSEIQISHNEETLRAQERDLMLNRRQVETSRRELEQMSRDREEAVKELRKVTTTHSMGEIERRNITTELDKRNKEADELRRQVHQYIDEVRRIEELLQAKDEEHEMILNQYRSLSAEKTTLENHRTSLERETDTVRQSARDALENSSTLRTQLSRQSTLVKSYEEEIERLSNQVASLETQLSSVTDSEKVLNKDTKVAREYHIKMERNLDETRLKLADAESSQKQLEADNRDLRRHLDSLEKEIILANENYKKLDELVAASREKEFTLRRNIDERTAERDELKNQMLALTSRVDSLNDEFARSRLKCIELQTELDKLNRQLLHEKSSRETAHEELRRLQDSLNTSSTNMLLSRALDSSRAMDSSRRSPSPTSGRFGSSIGQIPSSNESRLPFSRSITTPPPSQSPAFLTADFMDSPIAASTSRSPSETQQKGETSSAVDAADKYGPW